MKSRRRYWRILCYATIAVACIGVWIVSLLATVRYEGMRTTLGIFAGRIGGGRYATKWKYRLFASEKLIKQTETEQVIDKTYCPLCKLPTPQGAVCAKCGSQPTHATKTNQWQPPKGWDTKYLGTMFLGAALRRSTYDLQRLFERQSICWSINIPTGFFLLPAGWLIFQIVKLSRRPRLPSQCFRCGYDLTGNTSGRCPECGSPRENQVTSASIQ